MQPLIHKASVNLAANKLPSGVSLNDAVILCLKDDGRITAILTLPCPSSLSLSPPQATVHALVNVVVEAAEAAAAAAAAAAAQTACGSSGTEKDGEGSEASLSFTFASLQHSAFVTQLVLSRS